MRVSESGLSGRIVRSPQFERRDEGGDVKAELRVHAPDVTEPVRVREVLAVPREEEIALVKRGEREVQCISDGVPWHDVLARAPRGPPGS